MKTNLKKALLSKLATFGLGVLMFGSTTAWAADMCFTEDTTNATYVGKNFSFPVAGECRSFNGFGVGGGCVMTGTACGTSNNLEIRFDLNYSCSASTAFGVFGTRSFTLDRRYPNADKTNIGYYSQPNNTGTNATWEYQMFRVKTIPCASPVPVN